MEKLAVELQELILFLVVPRARFSGLAASPEAAPSPKAQAHLWLGEVCQLSRVCRLWLGLLSNWPMWRDLYPCLVPRALSQHYTLREQCLASKRRQDLASPWRRDVIRTWSGPNMAVAALIQRYLDQPDYALENREATFYEFERTVIRVHNVGRTLLVCYRLPLLQQVWPDEEDYDYDGLDDDDDDDNGNDYDHHDRTRDDEHTACLEQATTNALASSQQSESREDEDEDARHHAGLMRGIAGYMRKVYGLHYGVRLHFGRRATELARQGHRSCSNSPLRKYQGDDEPNEGEGAANDDNNDDEDDDGDCSFFHFAADVDLDGGLGPYAHALAFELAQARTDLMLGLFESFFSSSSSSSSVSASRASRSLSLSVRDGVEWTLSAQAGGPRHFAVRIAFADDRRRQLVSNMFGHDVPYYAPLFLDMRGAGSPVKLSCDGAGAMTLIWDVAMLEAQFQGPAPRRRMWAQLAHCHRAVTLACCQAMREWHGRFRNWAERHYVREPRASRRYGRTFQRRNSTTSA